MWSTTWEGGVLKSFQGWSGGIELFVTHFGVFFMCVLVALESSVRSSGALLDGLLVFVAQVSATHDGQI